MNTYEDTTTKLGYIPEDPSKYTSEQYNVLVRMEFAMFAEVLPYLIADLQSYVQSYVERRAANLRSLDVQAIAADGGLL